MQCMCATKWVCSTFHFSAIYLPIRKFYKFLKYQERDSTSFETYQIKPSQLTKNSYKTVNGTTASMSFATNDGNKIR